MPHCTSIQLLVQGWNETMQELGHLVVHACLLMVLGDFSIENDGEYEYRTWDFVLELKSIRAGDI